MSEQIKTAIVIGLAAITGIAFAIMVNPPEDADFLLRVAYHAIGFVIGFAIVGLGSMWLIKRFNL